MTAAEMKRYARELSELAIEPLIVEDDSAEFGLRIVWACHVDAWPKCQPMECLL